MIKTANLNDLNEIEKIFSENFQYERTHHRYTLFEEGIYPTKEYAIAAIKKGEMFLLTEEDIIKGTVIFSLNQPPEYEKINWKYKAKDNEKGTIHLLLVRPAFKNCGVASMLLSFTEKLGKEKGLKVLRLDTGQQNTPAINLYQKKGFRIAESNPIKIGGVIEHKNHLFLEKEI